MIVRYIICPVCGNETIVNNMKEIQKCECCRRLITVKFNKKKKRKIDIEVDEYEEKRNENKWILK